MRCLHTQPLRQLRALRCSFGLRCETARSARLGARRGCSPPRRVWTARSCRMPRRLGRSVRAQRWPLGRRRSKKIGQPLTRPVFSSPLPQVAPLPPFVNGAPSLAFSSSLALASCDAVGHTHSHTSSKRWPPSCRRPWRARSPPACSTFARTPAARGCVRLISRVPPSRRLPHRPGPSQACTRRCVCRARSAPPSRRRRQP